MSAVFLFSDDHLLAPADLGDAKERDDVQPVVEKVVQRMWPEYDIHSFDETVYWERLGREHGHKPDFCMIRRDYGHWIVVEVEMARHRLGGQRGRTHRKFSQPVGIVGCRVAAEPSRAQAHATRSLGRIKQGRSIGWVRYRVREQIRWMDLEPLLQKSRKGRPP